MRRTLLPIARNTIPFGALALAFVMYHRDQALRSAPASEWMTVSSIVVTPGRRGADPILTVSREIRRPFTADWIANVRRLAPDNGTVVVCAASGRDRYRPDSRLPQPTTLTWWLAGARCAPGPGRYIIDTTWAIDLAGDIAKTITVESPPYILSDLPPP